MMKYLIFFKLFISFISKCSSEAQDPTLNGKLINMRTFVYWPNATVPFFIDPNHFDHEQAMAIMTSLSMFAFKTCIKFMPVMTAPTEGQHVLTFVNPEGVKRCKILTVGHSNFSPHLVQLGYECLKSSEIDMIIMRALGLPFEHNRMSRDIYIDVMIENIEPSYIELFTKDSILPPSLRAIPYDVNSVMHFGERDYSKNGHRTIIFKIPNMRPNKNGLSDGDVKKIELIYGPECRNRDRAEKYALCQAYPGLGRRKREIVEPFANVSLRVNPNITPPPEVLAGITKTRHDKKPESLSKVVTEDDDTDDVPESINTLDIVKQTDRIVELVYQLSSQALKNARDKYCNITSNASLGVESQYKKDEKKSQISADVFGTLKVIEDFAKAIIDDAEKNPKEFCQNSETLEVYQRQCRLDNDARCPKPYRSSKTGAGEERLSTEHQEVGDKNRTADATTHLKLNRRKREATSNVTTSKSSEAIKDATTTVTTFKSSEAVKEVPTTVSPSKSLKAVKQTTKTVTTPSKAAKEVARTVGTPKSSKTLKEVTTTGTTPKSLRVLTEGARIISRPKPSKALKEATNSSTTSKSLETAKVAARTISTPKSSKAFKEVTSTITILKPAVNIKLKDVNLKERIKAMRKERRLEIQRANLTVIIQLEASTTDPKVKENKTIPSRREIKEIRMARLMEKQKSDVAAKLEKPLSNKDSKFKKDSSKRRFEMRKKRLKEIQNAKTQHTIVIEDKTEPFRRVSMEQKYAPESSRDSSEESETEESEISLYNDREQKSGAILIESESSEETVENTTPEVKIKKTHNKQALKTVTKESESDVSEEPVPKRVGRQKKKEVRTLSVVPTTVDLSKLNVEFYAERRWPHGDLIYVIKELRDYDLEDLRDRLAEVNSILTQKTCVKLREVDAKEAEGFEDYLILDNSPDFVTGRVGGKQNFGCIELFEGGHHKQLTAMMVMSMLGFYFEVSRHDRDQHIRVHNRHIRADKLHHFEKMGDEATLDLPYDYKSATHPAIRFWRKIGKNRLSTVATYKLLDPYGSVMRGLGENSELLSESDIIKINSVYGVKCFLNRVSRSNQNDKKTLRRRSEHNINVI